MGNYEEKFKELHALALKCRKAQSAYFLTPKEAFETKTKALNESKKAERELDNYLKSQPSLF